MAVFTATPDFLARMDSQIPLITYNPTFTQFLYNYTATYSPLLTTSNLPYAAFTQTPNLQPLNTREPKIQ